MRLVVYLVKAPPQGSKTEYILSMILIIHFYLLFLNLLISYSFGCYPCQLQHFIAPISDALMMINVDELVKKTKNCYVGKLGKVDFTLSLSRSVCFYNRCRALSCQWWGKSATFSARNTDSNLKTTIAS